jgi:hypothetical protein
MQRFCWLAALALVAGCGDDVRTGVDSGPSLMDFGPRPDLSRPDFGTPDLGPDMGPADPTCFDRIQNGDETDVDCGGTACVACGPGAMCELDVDCALMTSCEDGFCRTPACMNEMLDTGEVDVDCGGDCPGCPDGTDCTMDADCRSGRCDDDSVCSSCSDGVQNGDESDVDCGGTDCSPCWGGESCGGASDCMSGVCTSGSCEGAEVYLEEDFGGSDGGWVAGGATSSWEYGTPSTATIDSAYTGTEVWVTNADGDYLASEDSWVESPSFDLSSATADPTLEAAIVYRGESCCDEFWLELSTDGGSSWDKVTSDGNATGWYNDTTNEWWDGDIADWTVARAVLTGAAGNAAVKVRFRMSADGSIQDEGFAFDDVFVFEDLCTNGVQDAGEADVDCGGTCDLCPGGATCTAGASCASGSCSGGVCDRAVYFDSDFEADDGSLTASGGLWEWGAPAGAVIDSASSGSNAWVTDLDGEYGNDENATLELPMMDLSGIGDDPLIRFDLWRDTEASYDGLWVEVSTDGGTSWDKLVDDGTFAAWYNDTISDVWFDSTSGGWERKVGVLTGTAAEADVRVRFVFDSDGSGINDGVALDDLFIGAPAPDLAVTVVPSAELCDAGTVVVRNIGTASVTHFDLTTVADGSSSTDRVTMALGPGGVYETTVAASSTIEATVAIDGDGDPSNDMGTLSVGAGIAVGAGSAYLETFEADDGDWVATGANSDWEHGEPTGTFIGNADSGTNAWVTDLSGTYAADQLSYLVSPCFDLSSLGTDPTLGFSRIFELEATNDHVHVELTTNGGTTWSKLGAFGTGTAWYNDAAGDFWDGSSGASDAWSRSSHPLTGAAGQSRVRLRFVMVSDGSVTDDGFGVDDVAIDP